MARDTGWFGKLSSMFAPAKQVVADVFNSRVQVRIGEMVRKTSCGRHAWFESNVGLIRKPI